MVTAQDVVNETRQKLQGSHVGARLDLLAGALTTSELEVVLTDSASGIRPGTLIELGEELMYVRSADEGTGTLQVIRGHNGTTAAEHAEDDLVRIAPSYTTQDIFRAVQDEFAALNGTGLRQYETSEIAYDGTTIQYDSGLDTDVDHLFVQNAEYESNVTAERWRPIRVELVTDANIADYASGSAFRILTRPNTSQTFTIRVTAATTFKKPTALGDTISEALLGTNDSIVPIVAIGAAWRLLLGKEAQRLNPDWSPGSRRAEEVDPGSIAFLGRAFESQRREMIQSALERQTAKYPPRQDVQL